MIQRLYGSSDNRQIKCDNMKERSKNIRIRDSTKKQLFDAKRYKETFEDVILRLLEGKKGSDKREHRQVEPSNPCVTPPMEVS